MVINPIPPVIESNTFPEASSSTLTVPDGSRNMYWIHPYWGRFGSIDTWGGNDGEETVFIADKVSYRITSAVDHTVEVVAAVLTGRGSEIEIPAEVKFDGQSYRVTGIANNGFENIAVSSISLPATTGYVGFEAFKGCNGLRKVECLAPIPPSVYSNSFDEDIYGECILEVPEDYIEIYRDDAVWGRFNIQKVSVPVSAIEINPSEWQGHVGGLFSVSATVMPADATDQSLVWTSSDAAVAKVDAEGNVIAVGIGLAVIRVHSSSNPEVYAECTVHVDPILVEEIILDPSEYNGEVGEVLKIKATVMPEDATDSSLVWHSSDETIATVDSNGTVALLKAGHCIITAEAIDGSGVTAECIIDLTTSFEEFLTDQLERISVYDLNGVLLKVGYGKIVLEDLDPGVYIVLRGTTKKRVLIK